MHYKKIVGIVLFLCGVALIIISFYIKSQVEEGKMKIARAEQQVEGGKKLFSWNPVTKQVGKGLTDPVDRKIAKGKTDVSYYETLSSWLMIIGIICIVGSLGTFLLGRKK